MVMKINLLFKISFLTLFFYSSAHAKKVVDESFIKDIKLNQASLEKLETYQRVMKKSDKLPYTVEFICFKEKKKSVLGPSTQCNFSEIKFVESK